MGGQTARSFGQVQVQRAQSEWACIKEAERLRKERELRAAVQREAELQANATPETIYKKRQDVAQIMFEKGQMTSDQLRAINEIGRVFNAITCSMFAKTSRYGELATGDGADWPPALRTAWRERYIPWSAEQSKIQVKGNTSRVELAIMVAVDNTGPRQAADRLGMDQRTVKAVLCESLYRYAEMAGWVEVKGLPLLAPIHSEILAA